MKVPISALREFLDFSLSPSQISDLLTSAGLEVEGIERTPFPFSGVVVGKVLTAVKHPEADRLKVATVFDGKETLQIVCGAPNCREGIYVALAQIGALLPEEEGKTFKIKKGKIRGQESQGMLCSSKELGLGEEGEGIIELTGSPKEGTPLEEIYGDVILDISLTPNLGHCMSVLGIARELSALTGLPLKTKHFALKENSTPTESLIHLSLFDQKQAPLFACRIVQNVTVEESPAWLQKKLEAFGLRSINVPIDIGNLVMMELGQPLHIFDYDAITDKKLIVTTQTEKKELLTLDGVTREIPPGAPLVCDGQGPLSFGGVMGGKRSSISPTTKNILIEAAYFLPSAIRKSSKLLGLKTDSSSRFEKGVDPCGLELALNYAAYLLQEVAGGSVCSHIVTQQAHGFEKKKITCRVKRINQLLGMELSLREIAMLLTRAHLEQVHEDAHTLTFLIPTYRGDLVSEIDLVEEVARLYGYNNIPKRKERHISSSLGHAPLFLMEKKLRDRLVGMGLQEVITCDLISPTLAKLSIENSLTEKALISVLSPSSLEQSVLRASLLPGLVQTVHYNKDRGFSDIAAFEIGKIHFQDKEQFIENSTLGIIWTGKRAPYHFDPKPQEVDFLDVKGVIENLLEHLHIKKVDYLPSHLTSLHPQKQAKMHLGSLCLGTVGQIHPDHLEQIKEVGPVYFAELSIETLLKLSCKTIKTEAIVPFPGSQRDWTLTVADTVSVGEILSALRKKSSPLLETVYLLDLYKSCQIGKDRKNVTFRFFYRDLKQTIDQQTVDKEHARVTQTVAELFQLSS